MVPESTEVSQSSPPAKTQDDAMLAGYRECATEALRWLSGLGYEPGHPLMRSLVAHLTKKQAYLENIDLEHFLVDRSMTNRRSEEDADVEEDESAFEERLDALRNDAELQRALIHAVFKGCDLHYL